MNQLIFRKLIKADVDSLYSLMDRVTALPYGKFYSPSGIEYYESRIDDYGAIFGVFDDQKLIAYAVLDFPGVGSDNFGRLIGIPDKELLRVALLAGCVVDPEYKGQGLQRKLCGAREQYALSMDCKHVFAMVHPDNLHSLNNIVSGGYTIILPHVTMEWGIRHILYKYFA